MSLATKSQIQFIEYVGAGRNLNGTVSIPGLKVGDVLLQAWLNSPYGGWGVGLPMADKFVPVVSTDDEIEQRYASDLSTVDMTMIFLRT